MAVKFFGEIVWETYPQKWPKMVEIGKKIFFRENTPECYLLIILHVPKKIWKKKAALIFQGSGFEKFLYQF